MRADHDAIARCFGALVPLQPIAWVADGLLCAPASSPVLDPRALVACPLPTEPLHSPPGWPDSPAALIAGWYRRSAHHAPAPPGLRELVQVSGEGFGSWSHPTTTMCLVAQEALPASDAVDAGCGSGLLAQAWASSRRRTVLAVDVNPAAIAQTRASAGAAGVGHLVMTRHAAIESLPAGALADRVVFANVPAAAHRALLDRFARPPRAVVVSGIRPWEAPEVLAAYRRLELRHVRAARHGRFDCHVLVHSR